MIYQGLSLEGKVALVTGSGRGIGETLAIGLAQAGADVVVSDLEERLKDARTVKERIEHLGHRSNSYFIDVQDITSIQNCINDVVKEFGQLDILVNNAGIRRRQAALDVTEEDWDAVMDTNLKGAFLCTKAAIRPMLRQRSGRIINMSSVVALTGNAGQANYTAAKAGLIGFTKTVAREVASRGITVNALAPGFIETRMVDELGEDLMKQIMERIPLARFGSTEDVAASVAFLASEDAAYITGQVLSIDGGLGL